MILVYLFLKTYTVANVVLPDGSQQGKTKSQQTQAATSAATSAATMNAAPIPLQEGLARERIPTRACTHRAMPRETCMHSCQDSPPCFLTIFEEHFASGPPGENSFVAALHWRPTMYMPMADCIYVDLD